MVDYFWLYENFFIMSKCCLTHVGHVLPIFGCAGKVGFKKLFLDVEGGIN